jgi:hypothetical protein
MARPHFLVGSDSLAGPFLLRCALSLRHLCDIGRSRMDFRFGCKSGRAADVTAMTEFGPICDIICPLLTLAEANCSLPER